MSMAVKLISRSTQLPRLSFLSEATTLPQLPSLKGFPAN